MGVTLGLTVVNIDLRWRVPVGNGDQSGEGSPPHPWSSPSSPGSSVTSQDDGLALETAGRKEAAVRDRAKGPLPRQGQESRLARSRQAWGVVCSFSKYYNKYTNDYTY